MVTVDTYSASAIPMQMSFGSTRLSIGTGFIWSDNNVHFLITNWHNLTGKNPTTGAHLSKTAAEPDTVTVWLNVKGSLGRRYSETFSLRDLSGKPLWYVHPQHTNQIDVVALPIKPQVEPEWYAINRLYSFDLALHIGQDVFVLGYPFGIGPGGYPIWKRGSIASEPEVFSPTQRFMLVDTASREGMSGSPVIRRSWGMHTMANGDTLTDGGFGTKFVGVYSGRLATNDPLDAQLGLVWPAALVEEIVAGRRSDV